MRRKNIYRERNEECAPLGELFFHLRKLTLPDRGPIRRFALVMVGVRGSLVGPEDVTLFTYFYCTNAAYGKNDNVT